METIHNKVVFPLLIDGGLSNVLEEMGCDLNNKLWTSKILINNPEAIKEAHLKYLKSGAQCITTSSYQASIKGFLDLGYSKAEGRSYILKSVELAETAIQEALDAGFIDHRPLIAASIGPYGAYLADGSEYRGIYNVSDKVLKDFHEKKIELLNSSRADILACETIPSFQETRVLSELLLKTEKPYWVSFSCKNEQQINDGTFIEECVELFKNHPNVFALGVNCTKPKYISGLVKSIKNSGWNGKILVYPNSGEAYNAEKKAWIGISDQYSFAKMVEEWMALGAEIIGGCCRIGPSHIKSIEKILRK